MKTWKVPVSWEMAGVVTVEAETMEEAIEIARDDECVIPLPDDGGDYIDGSWDVTEYATEVVRKLWNNNQPDDVDETNKYTLENISENNENNT